MKHCSGDIFKFLQIVEAELGLMQALFYGMCCYKNESGTIKGPTLYFTPAINLYYLHNNCIHSLYFSPNHEENLRKQD